MRAFDWLLRKWKENGQKSEVCGYSEWLLLKHQSLRLFITDKVDSEQLVLCGFVVIDNKKELME